MAFEVIIFDLDETLYPRDNGIMREVGHRIQMWMCDRMGLSWEGADALRREYFHRYGTTLSGLVVEHDVDVHEYLAFVHDIPVQDYLAPDPALAAMLDAIPLRKVVYTNASSEHAWRVLRALEVVDCFERVIGIWEAGLRDKIWPDAYERVLALLGVQGPACIMVEDSARNLRPAKELGLTTVLVDAKGPAAPLATPDGYVDFVVRSVLEVEGVVRGLLGGPAGGREPPLVPARQDDAHPEL